MNFLSNPATAAWLAESPLPGLLLTLLAYQAACWLQQRARFHPVANPVLIAIVLVAAVLLIGGIPYSQYFAGAKLVHFLLGPATVALAIPLYAHMRRLRAQLLPILLALLAGSLTAISSAMLIAHWLGASAPVVLSLAPKSVTTPIGMAIAERIGGLPSLTAVLVIVTGIVGAVAAKALFRLMRIDDEAVQGLAIGVAAHGIGTARAFQMSEQTGAFAALAMGLNGALTALLLPLALPWLRAWLG